MIEVNFGWYLRNKNKEGLSSRFAGCITEYGVITTALLLTDQKIKERKQLMKERKGVDGKSLDEMEQHIKEHYIKSGWDYSRRESIIKKLPHLYGKAFKKKH